MNKILWPGIALTLYVYSQYDPESFSLLWREFLLWGGVTLVFFLVGWFLYRRAIMRQEALAYEKEMAAKKRERGGHPIQPPVMIMPNYFPNQGPSAVPPTQFHPLPPSKFELL